MILILLLENKTIMKMKKAMILIISIKNIKCMVILLLKMEIKIWIATLMQMIFLREEQFQKIQLNNYFQHHKAKIIR